MSQTWFTSDLHLNHEGILEYTERGAYLQRQWQASEFHRAAGATGPATSDEHNKWVIDTLNYYVAERDQLYILGDVYFGANQWMAGYWISQINCVHKHLVCGNHDRTLFDFYASSDLFESVVEHRTEIKLNGHRIVLDHHPIAEWNNGHHKSWHLHGHSHGNFNYERANLHDKRILDVGWDNGPKIMGRYGPFSYEKVEAYMEGRTSIDHHGKAD
jgi:calcineurin-like phosphoesterase family protein